MGILTTIKKNPLLRNVILALCLLVIAVALTQFLLNRATRHGQAFEVPDLGGLTLEQADSAARPARLRLEITDSMYLPARRGGSVLEQNPAPGAKVKSGRRIFLVINAFNPRTAVIPYVTGYSLRQAKNNLEVAGFEIDKLIYRDDIATNNILEQQYRGRTIGSSSRVEAPQGAGVTLVVGRGADGSPARVPNLIGLTLKDAKSRLWEQGLNAGTVTRGEGVTEVTQHRARVSRQTAAAGSAQALGAAVGVTITLEADGNE